MMPVFRKALRTLFFETVLIVSLFALVGHLSVNFWERYMVQNELSKMKTSLSTLQNTITVISNAYRQLHKELHTLAHETIKGKFIDETLTDKHDQKARYSALAESLLQDIQIRSMIDNGRDPWKSQTVITQTIANEDTQTDINETTSYNPPLKIDYIDENIGDKGFHNKKTQYITRMGILRNKHSNNNYAEKATKKNLKPIAGNTKINELLDAIGAPKCDKYNDHYVQDNNYECQKNNCCSAVDKDYDSYLRF